MKSEPEECSIDDALAAPDSTVPWTGVRNYQARNFMRDSMRPGDGVLFYHSSCAVPGIAGVARIASEIQPDPSQFDADSPYYDAKSTPGNPRWLMREVQALYKTQVLPLSALRAQPALSDMVVLQKGSRLSITPVTAQQWAVIQTMLVA